MINAKYEMLNAQLEAAGHSLRQKPQLTLPHKECVGHTRNEVADHFRGRVVVEVFFRHAVKKATKKVLLAVLFTKILQIKIEKGFDQPANLAHFSFDFGILIDPFVVK